MFTTFKTPLTMLLALLLLVGSTNARGSGLFNRDLKSLSETAEEVAAVNDLAVENDCPGIKETAFSCIASLGFLDSAKCGVCAEKARRAMRDDKYEVACTILKDCRACDPCAEGVLYWVGCVDYDLKADFIEFCFPDYLEELV